MGLTLEQLRRQQQQGGLNQRQQTRMNFLQRQAGQRPTIAQPTGPTGVAVNPGTTAISSPNTTYQNLGSSKGIIKGASAANLEAAQQGSTLSNPNVTNPYGSQNVTYDEYGRPVINQNLSPEQQGLLSQEIGIESGANTEAQRMVQGGIYNQPFSATGVQQAFAPIRNEVMNSLYGDFEQQYEPQFQREQAELQEWASNTGNQPGSPEYNRRSQLMAENQNRARQSARAQAMGMGTQAVESGFRLGTEARDRPLQEISGLMGLGQGVQNPNFPGFTPTQVAPADVGGISTAVMQIKKKPSGGGGGRGGGDQTAEAQRIINEYQDSISGGDTSEFVGGGPQTMAATRSGTGSLNNMGRALRQSRRRRRR